MNHKANSSLQAIENVWNFLNYQGVKKDFVACATSHTQGIHTKQDNHFFETEGIIPDHAYTILGTYDITTKDEQVWLIKLRNPWGKQEWIGNWSDKSAKWTKKLREKVGINDQDDGIFVIPIENYV